MECPECSSEIRDDSHFCRVCGSRLQNGDRVRPGHTQAVPCSDGDLMIGSSFLDRYTIVEELGRGGMGVVYKAEDTKLRRHVALKFLPPELTRDPHAKERFVHEAQAASGLDHPNICIVYEIDETGDGQMFISMGCYDGETLKDKIERGPLEAGEVVDIAAQIVDGLEDAHDRGIVHRDIKPSNIMVTAKGQAKIMDFGLAKLAGQTRITKAGTTMGTIAYMSPEQARGEDIDQRTDIWSLGVVLYELLTGEQPFKGEYDQAVIYSILHEDHRPVTEVNRGVPSEIGAIVDRCLKKGPDDRYQSTGELAGDLIQLSNGSSARRFGRPGGTTRSLSALSRAGVLRVGIPVAAIIAVAIIVSVFPVGRDIFGRFLGNDVPASRLFVALLPWTMEGATAEERAFCDGMTRDLTGTLRGLDQIQDRLWVLPASNVERSGVTSPTDARKELGVNVTISGKMRRLGERYQLTLTRNDIDVEIEGGTGADIVRKRASRPILDPIANLSTWQDSVVVILGELLDVQVDPDAESERVTGRTPVPRAYGALLKGIGHLYPYRGEQDLESAVALFGEAIKQDSSYTRAYEWMGRACMHKYLETDDRSWADRGIAVCEQALRIGPGNIGAGYVMGEIHRVSGEYGRAIEAYAKVMETDGSYLWAQLGAGKAYSSLGNLPEATEAYRRAVESDSMCYEAHHYLGFALYQRGSYEDAIEPFRKLIQLKPGISTGYANLGGIYFHLGRWEEARDVWEASLAIDSTHYVCSNLGAIYFNEARYIDAARMYRKVLEISGEDYLTLGALAECYFWIPAGEDDARECFQRAIVLGEEKLQETPDDVVLLAYLAAYHGKLGGGPEARDLLETALGHGPTDPSLLVAMADTYDYIGNREKAVALIRRALDAGVSPSRVERFPGLRRLLADPRYRKMLDESHRDTTDLSLNRIQPTHIDCSIVLEGGENRA